MDNIKKIFIHSNMTKATQEVKGSIVNRLKNAGFAIADSFGDDVDMIICIGGDGTMLRLLRTYGFPETPILGVNTGHLGFFQEFTAADSAHVTDILKSGDYSIQSHRPLTADVESKSGKFTFTGINDVVIKRNASSIVHLMINISDTFIEKFSGDGILLSSSAGSTAYNYSVGGAIVDPRVEMLQLSPIAPMNTTVYRSLTSPLALPPDLAVSITPEIKSLSRCLVTVDGYENAISDFQRLTVRLSEKKVNIVRNKDYNFWGLIKDKLLQ